MSPCLTSREPSFEEYFHELATVLTADKGWPAVPNAAARAARITASPVRSTAASSVSEVAGSSGVAVAALSSWVGVNPPRVNTNRPWVVAAIDSDPPVVVTPWLALAMYARTSLLTSFQAIETAIESAAPTTPKPAATDAAPTTALMPEPSVALIVIDAALMPDAPSPSMNAWTSVAILLVAAAPAPLRLAPTTPPEIATD